MTTMSPVEVERELDWAADRERIERLVFTIRKLAGWHGIDIAELVDLGHLQDGDLDVVA